MKRKKVAAMLLTAVMVLSTFAGCGNQQQESPNSDVSNATNEADATDGTDAADEAEQSTNETADNQKIVVSLVAKTGLAEGWEALGEAYMAKHEGVEVVVDLKAEDGYDQWIHNVFASNDTTEVDLVNINYAGDSRKNKDIKWSDYMDDTNPYADKTWKEAFQYDMQVMDATSGEMFSLSLGSTQVMWFYNQEIFEEVGVEIPTTWNELIAACEKLEAAGYQPIAMPGDYDSFYSGTMGWLSQIYSDQTTRSMLPEVYRSQEGDYTYDPDLDADWVYDPTDPWNDDTTKVTRNPLRFWKAVYEGVYTPDTEGMATVWECFKQVFPKYAGGDAMFGTDSNGAQTLFYQGKAAMMVNGGWGIVEFANNMKAISSGEGMTLDDTVVEDAKVFTLGTFAMPSMEGDGIEAPARTIEVADGYLGAVSKDQEHNDLVVDFVMFYSSPEGMGIFLDAAIDAGYAPSGPSLVYDVEYPEEISSAFANVQYIGNCAKNYGQALSRGLCDLPESTREYYNNAYDCLSGNITVEEYLDRQVENYNTYFDTILEQQGLTLEDLEDVTTQPVN